MYINQDACLGTMIKAFQQGYVHMAIVLKSAEDAEKLRDQADKYNREIMRENFLQTIPVYKS